MMNYITKCINLNLDGKTINTRQTGETKTERQRLERRRKHDIFT